MTSHAHYTDNAWAVREARRQALMDAAKIAREACLVDPDGGEPTPEEVDVANAAADRILALAAQDDVKILMAEPDLPVLERAVRAAQRVTVFATNEHPEIRVVMLAPEEALALVKAGREALTVEAEVRRVAARLG